MSIYFRLNKILRNFDKKDGFGTQELVMSKKKLFLKIMLTLTNLFTQALPEG